MIAIIFIVFGLFFGSFYMVIGERWSVDESIISPGSHCPNCKHRLSWYELIPVISYLLLGGKCKNCKCRISIYHPLVEILTGLLFGLSYYIYGFSYELIIMLSLVSLMVIIFVSDFKYLLILDVPLIVVCAIILFITLLSGGVLAFAQSLLVGVITFLFMWLVKFGGDRYFKRESLGGGDVKLAFLFGITLSYHLGLRYGIYLSFVALVVASFLTYPMALYSIFKKKEKEIPFGPFLIMGLVIVYVFQNEIIGFLEYLTF